MLEAAGCQVIVPRSKLCCGRALYAEGMLDRAKMLLSRTMEELGEGDLPIVGAEPACIAAFRDELINGVKCKELVEQFRVFVETT